MLYQLVDVDTPYVLSCWCIGAIPLLTTLQNAWLIEEICGPVENSTGQSSVGDFLANPPVNRIVIVLPNDSTIRLPLYFLESVEGVPGVEAHTVVSDVAVAVGNRPVIQDRCRVAAS